VLLYRDAIAYRDAVAAAASQPPVHQDAGKSE